MTMPFDSSLTPGHHTTWTEQRHKFVTRCVCVCLYCESESGGGEGGGRGDRVDVIGGLTSSPQITFSKLPRCEHILRIGSLFRSLPDSSRGIQCARVLRLECEADKNVRDWCVCIHSPRLFLAASSTSILLP
jgi:hypothetical protein